MLSSSGTLKVSHHMAIITTNAECEISLNNCVYEEVTNVL